MKLQVTFEKEALEIIDELKKKTGVKDKGAVLVDALGKNKEKELVIPRPKR